MIRAQPTATRPPSLGHRILVLVTALVLFSIVLALLGEGAVRIRQWMRFGSIGKLEDTFTIDPATGVRILRPNLAVGGLRVNSLGFRGPELASPKPPGTIRLAFLGASTTYCAEVSSNEVTWPHLVWQALASAYPSVRFDYVNAGVPGYGYDSILKNFRLRVRPLSPDVVVIYEASNDFSSDSRELARRQGLVGERAVQESWLARYSLLWFLVEKNLTIRRLQASVADPTRKLVTYDPRALSRGFSRIFRETVVAAQEEARLVAVATFSTRLRRGQSPEEQARAAVTALYYMPYMTLEGLMAGYEEYNRVIRTVAHDTGALLIDGEDRIPPDARDFADSVHFTDAGSRVMAARVSEALLAAPAFKSLVSSTGAAHRAASSRPEPQPALR